MYEWLNLLGLLLVTLDIASNNTILSVQNEISNCITIFLTLKFHVPSITVQREFLLSSVKEFSRNVLTSTINFIVVGCIRIKHVRRL